MYFEHTKQNTSQKLSVTCKLHQISKNYFGEDILLTSDAQALKGEAYHLESQRPQVLIKYWFELSETCKSLPKEKPCYFIFYFLKEERTALKIPHSIYFIL